MSLPEKTRNDRPMDFTRNVSQNRIKKLLAYIETDPQCVKVIAKHLCCEVRTAHRYVVHLHDYGLIYIANWHREYLGEERYAPPYAEYKTGARKDKAPPPKFTTLENNRRYRRRLMLDVEKRMVYERTDKLRKRAERARLKPKGVSA